jgi:hypothetical protein
VGSSRFLLWDYWSGPPGSPCCVVWLSVSSCGAYHHTRGFRCFSKSWSGCRRKGLRLSFVLSWRAVSETCLSEDPWSAPEDCGPSHQLWIWSPCSQQWPAWNNNGSSWLVVDINYVWEVIELGFLRDTGWVDSVVHWWKISAKIGTKVVGQNRDKK